MTRSLKHLNALHAFEAAARLGTFTRAGKELGVTPAAVGQQVRILEGYLGKKLFQRSSSGLTPTSAAARALGDLHSGFQRLDAGFKCLEGPAGGDHLAVSVAPALAWKWIATRMPRLYERSPQIDLRMDASPRLADVAGGEFDIAIRYDRPTADSPLSVLLFRDYTLPVCTPDLCPAGGAGAHERALFELPLLHIEGETTEGDAVTWHGWAKRFGLADAKLEHGARYPQSAMAVQAALDGQGVALSGLVLVIDDLLSGRLVAPLGPTSALRAPYAYRMVIAPARHATSVQSTFVRWIKDEARKSRKAMNDFVSGRSAASSA